MYVSEAVFEALSIPGEYFYLNNTSRLMCFPGETNVHLEQMRDNMDWCYAGMYILNMEKWVFKGEEF